MEEGGNAKFVNEIEQITFNAGLAAAENKPVIYVTERCVFRLVKEGLKLVEVAPGIDIERDILSGMEFRPIVDDPAVMDMVAVK